MKIIVNDPINEGGTRLFQSEKSCQDAVFHNLIGAMSRKTSTSDFLKQLVGRPVVVKLNNGLDYRGVLSCLDGYMNIALEQTEEYVNGQLKNKYGDAFIRGNNAPQALHV
ncbi:U6 snRNA-associated Sm protein LSm6-like [Tropilaelaps mercedesae]|uniref:U6 snRNA-associated Sm protein LSm6-like n=1 Tax=Tropilaelaps mercedesae TaxID=418985 RepID=A0A1V9XN53_9ACAR|nr:U6 snRNA-associated Sm protein LSm6-like [Tropilaelaps mercedesae]